MQGRNPRLPRARRTDSQGLGARRSRASTDAPRRSRSAFRRQRARRGHPVTASATTAAHARATFTYDVPGTPIRFSGVGYERRDRRRRRHREERRHRRACHARIGPGERTRQVGHRRFAPRIRSPRGRFERRRPSPHRSRDGPRMGASDHAESKCDPHLVGHAHAHRVRVLGSGNAGTWGNADFGARRFSRTKRGLSKSGTKTTEASRFAPRASTSICRSHRWSMSGAATRSWISRPDGRHSKRRRRATRTSSSGSRSRDVSRRADTARPAPATTYFDSAIAFLMAAIPFSI